MLHYKGYKTYEEYAEDQVAKPKLREAYIRLKSGRKHREFLERFAKFTDFLEAKSRILCLGARFGEEVRAFRDLDYQAVGLDLFADETDLVIKGDWNAMPFGNGLFHCVYTNSIDHCFNLDTEVEEICRVLSPTGFVIIDLNIQHCHAAGDDRIQEKLASPERYEAMLWNDDNDVIGPFLEAGFSPKMVWLEESWHTYLLERNNGKDI